MILKEYVKYLTIAAVLGVLKVLPHQWRIRLAGRLGASFLSPVLGWKDRIGENLDLVMPELSQADRAQLIRKVSNNITRVFIELFSPKDMEKIASVAPFEGPGVKALDAALSTGRPVICVSGHFGNYDVFRAALIQRGFDVGALYRPMNDQRFNRRYEKSISAVGGKMFPRGRQGFISMIQHLKGGGLLALLTDQHMDRGTRLSFFGQTAFTAVSASQMALKYDAILVPIYAIRQADGLNFRIEVEAPLPRTDENTMTQALNDSLEAQVRAHPEQWLWTHRRWKTRHVSARGTVVAGAED